MTDEALKHLAARPFGVDAMRALLKSGLFAPGDIKKRDEMLEILRAAFKGLGGIVETAAMSGPFKRVLKDVPCPLEAIGNMHGGYRFVGYPDEDSPGASELAPRQPTGTAIAELEIFEEPEITWKPGDGKHQVYAWCLPQHSQHAVGGKFPVKIGWSGTSVADHLSASGATENLPESPRQLLAIRLGPEGEPHKLEQTIQYILSQHDRRVKSAPSTEWFRTNQNELVKIVEFISRGLA